jgi:hypothetical protein
MRTVFSLEFLPPRAGLVDFLDGDAAALVPMQDISFAFPSLLDIHPAIGNELLAQEFLRAAAVRAPVGAIDGHFGVNHGNSLLVGVFQLLTREAVVLFPRWKGGWATNVLIDQPAIHLLHPFGVCLGIKREPGMGTTVMLALRVRRCSYLLHGIFSPAGLGLESKENLDTTGCDTPLGL